MKKLFVSLMIVLFMASVAMAQEYRGRGHRTSYDTQVDVLVDQSRHGDSKVKNEAQERGFHVPAGVGYGPVINYYGKPLPGSQFRPVETLLMYANVFSEGALEDILKCGPNADLIVDLNVIRDKNMQVRASYENGETRWIKIIPSVQVLEGHGIIAYVTSEADNRKTDMMEVIAGAALAALREGADVLQIVAQGAARDTHTSGWGIGLHSSQATIMSGDDGSNITSGGTGYSRAWAGMRDKPWIQGNALKSPVKIIGVAENSVDSATKISSTESDSSEKVVKADGEKKVWGYINGKPQYVAN